jgi:hypothetical protein
VKPGWPSRASARWWPSAENGIAHEICGAGGGGRRNRVERLRAAGSAAAPTDWASWDHKPAPKPRTTLRFAISATCPALRRNTRQSSRAAPEAELGRPSARTPRTSRRPMRSENSLYRPHTIITCGKRSRMCMVRFSLLFRIVAFAQGPIRRHPVLDACCRARKPGGTNARTPVNVH